MCSLTSFSLVYNQRVQSIFSCVNVLCALVSTIYSKVQLIFSRIILFCAFFFGRQNIPEGTINLFLTEYTGRYSYLIFCRIHLVCALAGGIYWKTHLIFSRINLFCALMGVVYWKVQLIFCRINLLNSVLFG